MVVCVVTDQTVGDHRSPRATILGVETIYSSANPRFPVPPTGSVLRDGSFFLRIVTCACGFWDVGSLHLKASRRPSGQLLRQRQKLYERRCGVLAAAHQALPTLRRHQCHLLRQRHQRNDVAAYLKPAVAAEAIGKRKGVAASVADCCGSGFPCGQDVAASPMCSQFWTTVPVLHCAHEPSGRGLVVTVRWTSWTWVTSHWSELGIVPDIVAVISDRSHQLFLMQKILVMP